MITGVRLTQLANGEPLIGASWSYKELYGIKAIEKRLEDLFFTAQYLGFNLIIDTIKPQITPEGILTLDNNGIFGAEWPLETRLELYRQYSIKTGIQILLEVDFPGDINAKIDDYSNFFIELVTEYPWVGYWQVMVNPETVKPNGDYKCSPVNYTKFLNYVYPIIKADYPGIRIGGPGIYDALAEYISTEYVSPSGITLHDGWLAEAIGEKYGAGEQYHDIGPTGFLECIDFFSIQGRQDTLPLRYEIFPSVINKLQAGIKSIFDKHAVVRDLPIFSILQGHQAPSNDYIKLQEQPYYELREILNCIKSGVVPFKNQLVDEFFDETIYGAGYDASRDGFGLLYYYLGNDGYKPACNEYNFLLKNLQDYNISISDTIDQSTQVYETNTAVDSVTLINKDRTKVATIIWPKMFRPLSVQSGDDDDSAYTRITLKPHYYREYLLPTNEKQSIIDSKQIIFKNYDFVIVFEKIENTVIDKEAIENAIKKKLSYAEQNLVDLVNLLPTTYVKDVRDTNFNRLLRSLSFELADAQIQLDIVKDDAYLNTAHDVSIYNNFGCLIRLEQKPDWDNEKYRRLVTGVTKSLLKGPTPQSIVDALNLFTNFQVDVYELYKDWPHIDPGIYEGYDPQFTFVVEIEKPIEEFVDQETVYEDTKYVINIIKPAHTIGIIIIVLVGKENFRDQYWLKKGVKFENSDVATVELEENAVESTFGWKYRAYQGEFSTIDTDVLTNSSLTNNGLFLGPRYVLYDESFSHLELGTQTEKYPKEKLKQSMLLLLEVFKDEKYRDQFKAKKKYDFQNADQRSVKIDYTLQETKFGLVDDMLIKTNGGYVYDTKWNLIGNQGKILNKYRLSVHNKVKDDLGTILFDYTKGEDVSTRSRFEVKNKYRSGEIDFSVYDLKDKVRKGNDNKPDIYLQAQPTEYYRKRILGPTGYHTHKSVTIIMGSGGNAVYLPERDLFTRGGTDDESMTKVYVNGFLMPTWTYVEFPSELDPTKSNTIIFEDEVVREGDIVTVTYLLERTVIITDFPIKDNDVKFNLSANFGDSVDWNRTKDQDTRILTLNRTPLNGSMFLAVLQEGVYFELFQLNSDGSKTVLRESSLA